MVGFSELQGRNIFDVEFSFTSRSHCNTTKPIFEKAKKVTYSKTADTNDTGDKASINEINDINDKSDNNDKNDSNDIDETNKLNISRSETDFIVPQINLQYNILVKKLCSYYN